MAKAHRDEYGQSGTEWGHVPPHIKLVLAGEVTDEDDQFRDHFNEHVLKHFHPLSQYSMASRGMNANLIKVHQLGGWEAAKENIKSNPNNTHFLETMDRAHKLSAIIKSAPELPKPTNVYSGVSADFGKALENSLVRGITRTHLPAFTSASLHPHTAFGFAKFKPNDEGRHSRVLHISLPEGQKNVLYMAGASAHPNEREMLINAGTNLKLHGTSTQQGKHSTLTFIHASIDNPE